MTRVGDELDRMGVQLDEKSLLDEPVDTRPWDALRPRRGEPSVACWHGAADHPSIGTQLRVVRDCAEARDPHWWRSRLLLEPATHLRGQVVMPSFQVDHHPEGTRTSKVLHKRVVLGAAPTNSVPPVFIARPPRKVKVRVSGSAKSIVLTRVEAFGGDDDPVYLLDRVALMQLLSVL